MLLAWNNAKREGNIRKKDFQLVYNFKFGNEMLLFREEIHCYSRLKIVEGLHEARGTFAISSEKRIYNYVRDRQTK